MHDPRELYKEELLDHVTEFLFPSGDQIGCRYLKVSESATQSWFQDTKVLLSDGGELPVSLIPGVQIEVFLSNYGIGILSLALMPVRHHRSPDSVLNLDGALNFNYRLASYSHGPQLRFTCRTQTKIRTLSHGSQSRIGRGLAGPPRQGTAG